MPLGQFLLGIVSLGMVSLEMLVFEWSPSASLPSMFKVHQLAFNNIRLSFGGIKQIFEVRVISFVLVGRARIAVASDPMEVVGLLFLFCPLTLDRWLIQILCQI